MDKIVTLLQSLADKIGKTVEVLWPEAVRYTVINGAVKIIAPAIFMIIAVSIFLHYRHRDWVEGKGCDAYPGVKIFAAILTGIFMIATIVSSCDYLPRVIAPEGYLVDQILRNVQR